MSQGGRILRYSCWCVGLGHLKCGSSHEIWTMSISATKPSGVIYIWYTWPHVDPTNMASPWQRWYAKCSNARV